MRKRGALGWGVTVGPVSVGSDGVSVSPSVGVGVDTPAGGAGASVGIDDEGGIGGGLGADVFGQGIGAGGSVSAGGVGVGGQLPFVGGGSTGIDWGTPDLGSAGESSPFSFGEEGTPGSPLLGWQKLNRGIADLLVPGHGGVMDDPRSAVAVVAFWSAVVLVPIAAVGTLVYVKSKKKKNPSRRRR